MSTERQLVLLMVPYNVGCMAPYMTPYVSPSTKIEATIEDTGAFGTRPSAVEFIEVDGKRYDVIYGATYRALYATMSGADYLFVHMVGCPGLLGSQLCLLAGQQRFFELRANEPADGESSVHRFELQSGDPDC